MPAPSVSFHVGFGGDAALGAGAIDGKASPPPKLDGRALVDVVAPFG